MRGLLAVASVVAFAFACSAANGIPELGQPTDDGGTSQHDAAGTDSSHPGPEAGQGDVATEASPDAADASSESDDGSDVSDGSMQAPDTSGTWSSVSFGVTTLDTGSGDNIVIAYGGYTATDQDSQAWVSQMENVKLGTALHVGHMYAVRGPKDADYASREIGNSELAMALLGQAAAATYVIVIAHSSGGFVADELFTFADPSVIAKIAYFNLDGGSWALTNALVGSMRGVYFCNAHDSVAGDSENTSSDQSLHADFPASHYFTVDADGSGCDVGAGWCLHDTLIINHPHDPTTFDLALDYTDFTNGRQVVTSYIDQAVSDGVL